MQPTKFYKVVFRNRPFSLHCGGIDARLLGEIHHKINLIGGEDLLLSGGVVPLLWINKWGEMATSYN